MRWLFFPPVLSIVLLLLTALFNNRDYAYHIPPVIWGMTVAVYICMCGVSVFFLSKRENRYNLGITMLTQGVLLSVLSMQFGAILFSWVGLVLFLIGLLSVFFYATQGSAINDARASAVAQENQIATERERIESLLAKLELPICITDNKGIIQGATPRFYEAIGREPGDIEGNVINEVIPIDHEEATFESGTWWVSQVKEGPRYYFSLLPTPDCKPVKAQPAKEAQGPVGPSIYDPVTNLYTDEYRAIRGPEEVSRAQRYKRSLSGLLLELVFLPSGDVNLSDSQKEMLGNAFAIRVKGTLRAMDCGFLMKDKRIQILLPETPQAGAKTLLGRIMTLPQDVFDDDIREAVNPKVKAGMFFYNGATKMEYGVFSATLEEAFIKSKEGTIGTAGQAA